MSHDLTGASQRRLTALGQEVGLLAFIDTFHPRMPARDITVLSRLERLHREGFSYIRKALETQRRETQAARDERAIEEYRNGRTCHPLLPFADWAGCAPALGRLGSVVVAGCRDAVAARQLRDGGAR